MIAITLMNFAGRITFIYYKLICSLELILFYVIRIFGLSVIKKTPHCAAFSQRALFAHFCPRVTQAHGAVKDQLVCRGVATVQAEIAFAFELIRFTRFRLFQ